jgi:hypothetical protein
MPYGVRHLEMRLQRFDPLQHITFLTSTIYAHAQYISDTVTIAAFSGVHRDNSFVLHLHTRGFLAFLSARPTGLHWDLAWWVSAAVWRLRMWLGLFLVKTSLTHVSGLQHIYNYCREDGYSVNCKKKYFRLEKQYYT